MHEYNDAKPHVSNMAIQSNLSRLGGISNFSKSSADDQKMVPERPIMEFGKKPEFSMNFRPQIAQPAQTAAQFDMMKMSNMIPNQT